MDLTTHVTSDSSIVRPTSTVPESMLRDGCSNCYAKVVVKTLINLLTREKRSVGTQSFTMENSVLHLTSSSKTRDFVCRRTTHTLINNIIYILNSILLLR